MNVIIKQLGSLILMASIVNFNLIANNSSSLNTVIADSIDYYHTDTCSNTQTCHQLNYKKFILPASLITIGAFGISNGALVNLKESINDDLQGNNGHKAFRIDEVSPYLPAATVYALNACGIKGVHNFRDRTWLLGFSFAITQCIAQSTKRIVREERPNGEDKYSFPSGHTATAFMSAEYLRQEYKNVSPWIGVAGYSVALGTGFLRMYNNKHWLNDVVAGAGIGILGTRLAYMAYPWIQKQMFKHHIFQSKQQGEVVLLPYYNNEFHQGGIALSFQL